MAGIIPAGIAPAISAQIGKLAGETPVNDSTTADWQSGLLATSGEVGADLVSIGAAGDRKKIHSLLIDIGGLTATATITLKLFIQINGVEKKVYNDDWIVGTDPDGIWVIPGSLELHDILRVEVQSDNALDDGKAIPYTYCLEDM